MKRADIEPGKVYGYSEGTTRIYRYDPVMVVSTDLYMIDRYKRTLGPADEYHRTITSGRRSYDNAVGLLAVNLTPEGLSNLDVVGSLVTPEAAVAGINGGGRDITLPRGLAVLGRYTLITNQRYLHGDYATLQAELDEADAPAQRARPTGPSRTAWPAWPRYRALEGRLGALGITGYAVGDWENKSRFEGLRFEDMDTLLDLAESAVRANKNAGIGG